MQYTEKELWQLTPRQFKAQLDVHADIQRRLNDAKTQKEQIGYIDQLKGW
mgnify:CR=1 FL=1